MLAENITRQKLGAAIIDLLRGICEKTMRKPSGIGLKVSVKGEYFEGLQMKMCVTVQAASHGFPSFFAKKNEFNIPSSFENKYEYNSSSSVANENVHGFPSFFASKNMYDVPSFFGNKNEYDFPSFLADKKEFNFPKFFTNKKK